MKMTCEQIAVELSVLYKEEYKLSGRMLRCVFLILVKYSCRQSNIKQYCRVWVFFSRAPSTKNKSLPLGDLPGTE